MADRGVNVHNAMMGVGGGFSGEVLSIPKIYVHTQINVLNYPILLLSPLMSSIRHKRMY